MQLPFAVSTYMRQDLRNMQHRHAKQISKIAVYLKAH